MNERVAIITGAGRGIGRATAVELGRAEYSLALVGRRREALEETARSVERALIVPGDVSDPDACARIVGETVARFGRLDAVVNNAGYAPILSVEQTTPDEWRRVIDTNLSAAFYLARAAWPHLRAAGGGAVVNISSLASRDPFAGFVAYGSAKAGLNLLGLALAREGQDHNIRVHTVAPGSVETEMFRGIMTREQWPTEKTLDPAEVARVIVQCIQGDLRHTSGEVIYVHKTI